MSYMFIVAVAVFFFGMGAIGLIRPEFIPGLFSTTVTSIAGRNEVRAVYVGYGIAISSLLIYSLTQPQIQHGIFLTVAVAMLGMAFGRIVSLFIELRIELLPLLFMVVELFIALILLAE